MKDEPKVMEERTVWCMKQDYRNLAHAKEQAIQHVIRKDIIVSSTRGEIPRYDCYRISKVEERPDRWEIVVEGTRVLY